MQLGVSPDEFLDTIFGEAIDAGHRLPIFTLPSRRAAFFTLSTEAAHYALRSAATQDVYFGVGLIQGEPKSRGCAEDVATIGCLWADIDLWGPVHKNPRLPNTEAEARALLAEMPLPPSVIVHTGHGLHAYWFLHEPWRIENEAARAQAAQLAHGWHGLLCQLAARHDWQLENLGELARLMRVPGTLNHRGSQAMPVTVTDWFPERRYERSDFEPYLSEATTETAPAVDNVRLTITAEPPAIKLADALCYSHAFRATWNRQRHDLADTSASGYDLSLATQAALAGWNDQEIANLLIAARAKHRDQPDKALRPDYIRRTLEKARKAALAHPQLDPDVNLSHLLGEPDPPSMTRLLRYYPALRPPVIEKLLRQGETMNLISSPKLGKSWLVTDLALAIATGRPWLGRFPTVPGSVLILDNELHGETTAHRIPKVAHARGLELAEYGEHVFVENLRGRLEDVFGMARYFDRLEPGRFAVIILDAFYRFLPRDTDENDNGAMAGVYNHLDSYADRLGASFVLIHHTSKGFQANKSVTDVGAGAGSQSRATDTHLVLRPHEEPGCVVLDAAVRSWPPVDPCVLRWEFPIWGVDHAADPLRLRSERPKRVAKESATIVEKQEKTPWDAARFAHVFVTEPPQLEAAIVESALRAGLTERRAEKLLKRACDLEYAHRWQVAGSTRYANVPQPTVNQETPAPLGPRDERRALVQKTLLAAPELSSRQIATHCGVSHTFVHQVRESLQAAN